MTLDELIVALKRFKKEKPESGSWEVTTEGCDCWGDVASLTAEEVRFPHKKKVIMLERTK